MTVSKLKAGGPVTAVAALAIAVTKSALILLHLLFAFAVASLPLPVSAAEADSLYIGDGADNTVKRFDAGTGAFQGEFVKKGNSPIKGPRGLIFNSEGDLLVSNQNVGTNKFGEILKHDGVTGEFLGALVPHNDPNAPFAPRGIVLNGDALDVLFVADTSGVGKNNPPGRLLAYTGDGVFLADLTPDRAEFPGSFSTDEFHPRGVVLGPDGLLYVSVTHDLDIKSENFNDLAGWILRFDPNNNGSFVDIFASQRDSGGCAVHLHRPEGLVFGPDGKLYVTAFRAGVSDTDKILIFDGTGQCLDQIDLYDLQADPPQPRAFAQALLFGPEGCLFVPINNTGEVRRYNVGVGTCDAPPLDAYDSFVAAGGDLKVPWYLTFGNTDPRTLQYQN
jgi:DNA-binding beta-propeller fold protein YncE